MKACVLHAINDLRCETVPDPEPRGGEIVVQVKACGVCGSDIPRIFSKGTYKFPTIPGHEFAGVVTAAGPGADASLVGKAVTVFPLIPCRKCPACETGAFAQCQDYDYLGSRSDGAFAQLVRAPQWNVIPLPDGVSFEQAATTEPAAVALHAVRLAAVEPGDVVLVVGAGPVGLMAAMWARISGAREILLVDIDPQKLEFANTVGFEKTFNPARDGGLAEWISDIAQPGADVTIDAAGAAPAVETALAAARVFGRVVLLGNPAGEMKISQEAWWAILRKELCLRGSWNSTRTQLRGDEWNTALHFMATGKFDPTPLITHRVNLEKLPEALNMMHEKTAFYNKVMTINPR